MNQQKLVKGESVESKQCGCDWCKANRCDEEINDKMDKLRKCLHGGVHYKGEGQYAELLVLDSSHRFELLSHIFKYFNRIELRKDSIYVDILKDMPEDMCWFKVQ